MDLNDKLQQIVSKFDKIKTAVTTEEATKNAFIMPFIASLGYDVFNPTEVIPEFTADIGAKKGEKVDYCILKDDKPVIIMECKHWSTTIDVHTSQLLRYFTVVDARFGIITNGIQYKFYSDLEEKNKMDTIPFLEFSLTNLNDGVINEIKKFSKESFSIDSIIDSASEMKYSKAIKEVLQSEFKEPSEEFVKLLTKRVYSGVVTKKIIDQFTFTIQKSLKQYISELISERLKVAIKSEEETTKKEINVVNEKQAEITPDENGILTTTEEMEGYKIVQAIVRKVVPLSRVSFKDTKGYFGILLDDSIRKSICRLHFNTNNKYITLFNEKKEEQKFLLEKIEDIYNYDEYMYETIKSYDASKSH